VSGVFFGALILDEPVTGPVLAALALIGGGIYLVNRGRKSRV
jgi:drug/metabolite transporter (DMT)-like permease